MRFGRNATQKLPRASGDGQGDPREVMARELATDERLIWAGRPVSVRGPVLAKLPISFFGLFFGGFALFWIQMAASMGGGFKNSAIDIFPLFGIPFLVIGAGMVLSPVWAGYKAQQTVYALTNERIIIREGGLRPSLRSWHLDELEKPERRGGEDAGDIYLASSSWTDSKGRTNRTRHGFLGIADVREVENAIREARKAYLAAQGTGVE